MNRIAVPLLLGVGLMQMAGDLAGIPALKGIGAATASSPAPKVFSVVQGLETYSTRFFLEWKDEIGKSHSLEITSEVYSRLTGPYNRRNVYGAAMAYGPVLETNEITRPMFRSVVHYAMCGDAPVLREFGIDPATIDGPVFVRYEPLPGSSMDAKLPRRLEVRCR
ncbi:MAG: hypothetical protein IID45_01230 [Planctomycetes bacterium]|nr:hypothetical protein [Planctomycetota bacterium]